MPASDIGIDLGTRNSLAYSTGKGLVLNEPSIVVYDKNTEKIRAIGEEARLMEGRITSAMAAVHGGPGFRGQFRARDRGACPDAAAGAAGRFYPAQCRPAGQGAVRPTAGLPAAGL